MQQTQTKQTKEYLIIFRISHDIKLNVIPKTTECVNLPSEDTIIIIIIIIILVGCIVDYCRL